MFIWLAAVAFTTFAASAFDALETVTGLRKGVAVEGNSIINWLGGSDKPPAWAIWTFNTARIVLAAALGLVPNPAFTGAAFGALITFTIGHIQAGRKWAYLNAGGKIDPTKAYTWWQKFLGLDWN